MRAGAIHSDVHCYPRSIPPSLTDRAQTFKMFSVIISSDDELP